MQDSVAEGPDPVAGFHIAEDDLDEIEHIGSLVLRAAETNNTATLFSLYQRLKHISIRVRGTFKE